jgi:hypothetical protein
MEEEFDELDECAKYTIYLERLRVEYETKIQLQNVILSSEACARWSRKLQ